MRRLPFHSLRKRAAAVLAVVLVLVSGCGGIDQSGFSGDVNILLARGGGYAAALSSRPSSELTDPEVIALGYLERARIGLGSPFRLIDFALSDPSLPADVRERLAYAILSQVLSGRIYQVEPAVLDLVHLAGPRGSIRAGQQQMQLIEREIASAPTASSGERAVRLGYRLAEAERSVTGVPQSVVAHVAALVADRRRAREDAATLLRTAAQLGEDPLDLVRSWRRDLRFRVEAPALAAVSVREEEAEARSGPQVAVALRVLAQRHSAPTSFVGGGDPQPAHHSYLHGETSSRLLALSERRDHPPQAPIAVAISINREPLVNRAGLQPWERDARARFADQAWNEERLIAGREVLRASGASLGFRLHLIDLQAATFMRVWNQEEPWFPGDPAPAARDLEARFGLGGVEFDADVRESWRPYYLRMLGRGLSDLQRVMPTVSLRGLRIRIGPLPQDLRALALHEPHSRTLFLPPLTGSGTIAHEIAHDLDWQLARARYSSRGGYATDLAVRAQRGDRIATSVGGLAAALTRPTAPDAPPNPHETRPAEVFARGFDWFIAAVLASEGRTGGYLTSFQDASLTGYGTTRGPDVGGGAIPALFSILDGVAPVVERTRDWAVEAHGPARPLTPAELVAAVLDVGRDQAPQARLSAISTARDRTLSAVNSESCRLTSAEGIRRLTVAQRALIEAAAGAAARGAAIDGVRSLGEMYLEPRNRQVVDEWIHWRIYGAPEPLDSTLVDLAPAFEDLLLQAAMIGRPDVDDGPTIFGAVSAPTTLCRGNPFATALLRPSRAAATPPPGGAAREAAVPAPRLTLPDDPPGTRGGG
jgi:hypothetical protein